MSVGNYSLKKANHRDDSSTSNDIKTILVIVSFYMLYSILEELHLLS